MSIVSMRKIVICAKIADRKNILEFLQRVGLIEISNLEISNSEYLKKINTEKNQVVFEKSAKDVQKSIEIISNFNGKKTSIFKSLEGREQISKEKYYKFVENKDEIVRIAHEVIKLNSEIAQEKADICRLNIKKEKLALWRDFDYSMSFKGTKNTRAFLGTLPNEFTYEELLCKLAKILPDVDSLSVEILGTGFGQTRVFILCRSAAAEKVAEAMSTMGFAHLSERNKYIPAEKVSKLEKKINALEKSILKKEAIIKSYAGATNALRFICDYFTMRAEKYAAISKLICTKNVFLLEGFVPKKISPKLEGMLSAKFEVAVDFEDVQNGEAPVLLKNAKIAEPVEAVVESYSLPGKNEVDPTSLMSIFYYVLFGLMLSDAAYGALMSIGCFAALKKFKNMENGLKKTLRMFFFCGISTIFWGVMFGSYFGNAVEVISETFFGAKIVVPPLWFTPLQRPMFMLSFSFGLGVLHIFAGLFLLMCQLIIAKKYKDVLYDVFSWYFLIGGGLCYVLAIPTVTSLLDVGFTLPNLAGQIGASCALLGALCILLTSGRASKSVFKRFLKGIYGLYGATSYLSDIFSYSRLFALGLATGVIAQVFNQMGAMAGGGIFGAILFAVVFVIGHTMNIAINLLGAYVHTNRLQFVEFFSKFYEGGGRKFVPFAAETKYYKIVDDV